MVAYTFGAWQHCRIVAAASARVVTEASGGFNDMELPGGCLRSDPASVLLSKDFRWVAALLPYLERESTLPISN